MVFRMSHKPFVGDLISFVLPFFLPLATRAATSFVIMAKNFEHRRTSRNTSSYVTLTIAIGFLFLLIFGLNAHPIIVAGGAVLISPAIWSILANTQAYLEINDHSISWQVGQRGDAVEFDDLDYVKARTSLDLSQRVTVVRKSGPKLHIPGPCLPGGRKLDQALETRGVRVKRLF